MAQQRVRTRRRRRARRRQRRRGAAALDKDTLLYAVPKGGKQGLHCIAVRVIHGPVSAEASDQQAGWSPPFSLLLGPFSAERAFRAGGYDLAVDIRPAETAARERTKVVTFVQRFWLSNRLGTCLEVEQWSGGGTKIDQQPMMPLAVGERAPFHWPHPKVKEDHKLLRIRPLPGQGSFGLCRRLMMKDGALASRLTTKGDSSCIVSRA